METALEVLLAVLVVEIVIYWLGPADWGKPASRPTNAPGDQERA